MNKEKLATLIADTFEAFHRSGRYDAAARLVPHLDQLSTLPEDRFKEGVFGVLDQPSLWTWSDTLEGYDYWNKAYESLAFETGGKFRELVDQLLESEDLDEHEKWHALEEKRLELDTTDRNYGTKYPSFKETMTVSVEDGGVTFDGDERWLGLLHRYVSSEIVDYVSRVPFETPFKARKGDAKRMFVQPEHETPEGWTLLGEAPGSVTIHPDEETIKRSKSVEGEWYLYVDDRATRNVHAVKKDEPDTIVSTSFNEAMNRIFRAEPDLMTEAARLAFLHDKVELKLEFKE